MRSTQSSRRQFKSEVNAEDSRRRRVDTSLGIRKDAREEGIQKRRMMNSQAAASEYKIDPRELTGRLASAPEFVEKLNSGIAEAQLEACIWFRKLLSIEKNPPINQVIGLGVIPRLVQFLTCDHPKLQFEAAWALTNIASGNSDQTKCVVASGALPIFVQLLMHPDPELREQAVWAVGNIAGDGASYRDTVIGFGVCENLLAQFHSEAKLTLLRNATWGLSNLCRGKPHPDFSKVRVMLPTLAKLIDTDDEDLLVDTLWALSYLSDGEDYKIQAVIESGVVPRAIHLLKHKSSTVQTPALRLIGNIVTGNGQQTDVVVKANALANLRALLSVPKRALVKEAAWAISNITAGTESQIDAVIEAHIIPVLIHLLATAEFDIKKEAAWALSNACSQGTTRQVCYFVQHGLIRPLIGLLEKSDPGVLKNALEALQHILKAGESQPRPDGTNPFASDVEDAGGLDILEELQDHENPKIYQLAVDLLETYFGAEDENENAPEQKQMMNVFQFNPTTNFQGSPNGFSSPVTGFQPPTNAFHAPTPGGFSF